MSYPATANALSFGWRYRKRKASTVEEENPPVCPLNEESPDDSEESLVSADIVLPEDEFASYQSYLLYEIVRAKYIMINFLLFVLAILDFVFWCSLPCHGDPDMYQGVTW
ncbi:BTE_HP_G0003020.mRNA.1.CDS.1 [Saccharomyces cerevisiae]|nr:BTE_HP_G0003020.mRNA.1.CDS.1 [Saccharomyces cerevisiae]CAI6939523.1 BTE_HP_G0003020.mRNA.1.CDS.1 [Saccharomyces cerevisiae]